ncbi:lysozyme inhibitor LprI family protein [Halocynthiibacter sp. C4]|uniref:lysozyme inhibitor LprI family protein n=1 Tax=Halocynthiibacter sp. C4 TaxID=2992758 RepID=UPI00237C41C1|nr:lysozyme inhibitor LprI family protein [Halocynthiibacter sp. C4]MDE0589302.1 lysozyme inhibitor LprI family protein [Halocynthiibacter sp. C4]
MRLFLAGLSCSALLMLPYAATAEELNCDDPVTQREINACAYQRYLKADEALNLAWEKAMTAMKEIDAANDIKEGGAADTLLAAQRLWISYRDKACEAEGWLYRGGTLEPFIVSSCLEDLSNQRTERLEFIAEIDG